MPDENLLALLQITDLTLPIGAYAHSSGLETYVQKKVVNDLPSAKDFVTGMLRYNIRYTDAAFVSLAYEAAVHNDWIKILQCSDECTAVKLPAEIRKASQKLGMRLIKIFDPLCRNAICIKYKEAIVENSLSAHYAISFGIYSAALGITKSSALTGFYYNAAAGIVTNCVKLIPIGQIDGQQLLFSLQPLIRELVQQSLRPDPALIGFSCAGFDIRCMQHEELYSRLYMS